ncbi:MAG: riboflavin biosynthesis protein RibD, partial [Epsilonproteobacteria bacterium]|nr:riboflavin biosynthesis protein RibD [Campylobacterota bacterium]
LLPFTKWQDKNFVFFKIAMSQNGVISPGIITSENSRKLVHSFRNVCDLLVIGGNTVRIDRPTLDARLCNAKAPDILIYSKKEKFDKDIPLFKVKNRKVFIANNFDILNNYKNIMIEGGARMLKATKEITNLYAIFHSSNFKSGEYPDLNLNLELLNLQNIQGDTLGWLK